MRPRLKPQVLLLGLAALLNDTASEMIYPLLPIFLTVTLGATPVVIGVIEGAADGLASILKLWAGAWSDRSKRRKPLIVAGYALAAGSRALIGAASAWAQVLTARLIDRTGKGIRSAPRDALIADVTPAIDRGRAFGFHRALDHTGAVIGPLIAIVLMNVFLFSTRQVFFLAVIPGAIAVVLLAVALREPEVVASPLTRPSATLSPLRGARGHMGEPGFRRVLFAIALFSLANSSDAFLILQAHAAGVSTAMLPALWAAHHVVKSLFSTHAGALSDRIGRRQMVSAGWLLYAVTYAVFPFARSLTFFFVLFVFYAIPFTLFEGAERALIAELVPPESRGRSFGMFYLVSGFGVLAGSALFGALYQFASAHVAFFAGAGLATIAAIIVAINPRS